MQHSSVLADAGGWLGEGSFSGNARSWQFEKFLFYCLNVIMTHPCRVRPIENVMECEEENARSVTLRGFSLFFEKQVGSRFGTNVRDTVNTLASAPIKPED